MKKILKILEQKINITQKKFLPVVIHGKLLGLINAQHQDRVTQLSNYIKLESKTNTIHITLPSKEAASVTNFFSRINQKLVEQKVLEVTHNHEMCPVAFDNLNEPLFSIARYAIPFWGLKLYGVHLNGLTRVDGKICMWVSERSQNRHDNPGKLDHLVSGVLVSGLSIKENLCKEAKEEANVPLSTIEQAIPVGVVRCTFWRNDYMYRCVPFIYDLWLPNDFKPINLDKGVSQFFMMPLEELIEKPNQLEKFKTGAQFVLVNLLMRYGFIDPDTCCYEKIAAILQL